MSISFIHPIFGPDDPRTERNVNSIKSFGDYIQEYPHVKLQCIFGGWAYDDEKWNTIVDAIKTYVEPHCDRVQIHKFKKNYGKATVVNFLVDKMDPEHEYFLTADSDILFPLDTQNMFERLLYLAINAENARGKPTGYIALNQKGQSCHYKTCWNNEFVFENKDKIVWPPGESGIAGGALFFKKSSFLAVGKYPDFKACYSGDDAYVALHLFKKGYSIQIADDVSIIHPPDHDEEYAKWKVMVCQRDSGRINNHEEKINEANDFWERKNK